MRNSHRSCPIFRWLNSLSDCCIVELEAHLTIYYWLTQLAYLENWSILWYDIGFSSFLSAKSTVTQSSAHPPFNAWGASLIHLTTCSCPGVWEYRILARSDRSLVSLAYAYLDGMTCINFIFQSHHPSATMTSGNEHVRILSSVRLCYMMSNFVSHYWGSMDLPPRSFLLSYLMYRHASLQLNFSFDVHFCFTSRWLLHGMHPESSPPLILLLHAFPFIFVILIIP